MSLFTRILEKTKWCITAFHGVCKRTKRRISELWITNTPFHIRRFSKENDSRPRFLLVTYAVPHGINTVRDSIIELCKNSKYRIDWYNPYPFCCFGRYFNFYRYDGIIIHNTINYEPNVLFSLDAKCLQKLRDYRGLKIMFKQDEHFRHGLLLDYLDENPFDLMLTICSKDQIPVFYPKERFPNMRFLSFLTGYVSDELRNLPNELCRLDNRPIDVGYRGSIQPLSIGRLGYEKRQIGTEFLAHAEKSGLKCDISSRWEDRFSGDDWLRFLSECKAVLGVESGASIVDFDGRPEADFNEFIKQNPDADDEAVLKHLSKYESGPQYRGISPRLFEAAACSCVLVMYPDEFQGIFLPNVHYIPLERDFSNFDDVVRQIRDPERRAEITKRTYEDIIQNPKYSYRAFVSEFDDAVGVLLEQRKKCPQA